MDYNEIRKIIQDMGSSKLDTLEIEFPDGLKIKMDKGTNETSKNIQCVSNDVKQSVKNVENLVEQAEEYNVIKSPMVGTFYSKSSPKSEPFVKVGDKVKNNVVLNSILWKGNKNARYKRNRRNNTTKSTFFNDR